MFRRPSFFTRKYFKNSPPRNLKQERRNERSAAGIVGPANVVVGETGWDLKKKAEGITATNLGSPCFAVLPVTEQKRDTSPRATTSKVRRSRAIIFPSRKISSFQVLRFEKIRTRVSAVKSGVH